MGFFVLIGPFFQSFSEARGAAAPVFQIIDEVKRDLISTAVFSIRFHNTDTRRNYK
jgi:hypothetical protein